VPPQLLQSPLEHFPLPLLVPEEGLDPPEPFEDRLVLLLQMFSPGSLRPSRPQQWPGQRPWLLKKRGGASSEMLVILLRALHPVKGVAMERLALAIADGRPETEDGGRGMQRRAPSAKHRVSRAETVKP